jgi:hypothetical protein
LALWNMKGVLKDREFNASDASNVST